MDTTSIGLGLLGLILILAMLKSAWDYVFPPRCEKCGRRYNHKAHDECPYCHPLRRPAVTSYAPVLVLCAVFVGLGLLLSDGVIIGCGIALLVAIVVSTQKQIPWDEISGRTLLIGLLCVGIVLIVASQF
jgi:hypothetical protein